MLDSTIIGLVWVCGMGQMHLWSFVFQCILPNVFVHRISEKCLWTMYSAPSVTKSLLFGICESDLYTTSYKHEAIHNWIILMYLFSKSKMVGLERVGDAWHPFTQTIGLYFFKDCWYVENADFQNPRCPPGGK